MVIWHWGNSSIRSTTQNLPTSSPLSGEKNLEGVNLPYTEPSMTTTSSEAFPSHPLASPPETVYTVVLSGDATGFAIPAFDSVSAGSHVYELSPLAVS